MLKIVKEKGGIYAGEGIWDILEETIEKMDPSSIFLLVDSNTKDTCLPHFLKNITLRAKSTTITIEAGEESKHIETCLNVWNILSSQGADRASLLINLGGGVVTDLGGFVASTFMRGISFINIPTSLLAMVDASVGGKNGVDLGVLKNQIGIINNPEIVLVDTTFLQTLPDYEINSGFAEMLKHGLISSKIYWDDLKGFNVADRKSTQKLIWESILIKNEVVTKDPFEKKERKTLNYGHTLGHAIESYRLSNQTQETLLHGEAIAIGMILATFISSQMVDFSTIALNNVTSRFLKNYKKREFNEADIQSIIKLLKHDKKNRNGEIRFVLLQDFGRCKLDCFVDNNMIIKAFEFYKNFSNN